MSKNQKVWIFVIQNELNSEDLYKIKEECKTFIEQWTSHEQELDAEFELYKNRLLIFKNNEGFNPIGGCATDKLFHFIQKLESKYNVSLLNRQLVVYENNNEGLQVCSINDLERYLQEGILNENTIIYNTSIMHSSEYDQFAQTLKDSWLSQILQY